MLLTDFLWLVSVAMDFPAARSHIRMVESLLPVMIWGSVMSGKIDDLVGIGNV